MNKIELYEPHIEKAVNDWSHQEAEKFELKRINCPGFEYGVRWLTYTLVGSGLIESEKMYEFLSKRTKEEYKDSKLEWWR